MSNLLMDRMLNIYNIIIFIRLWLVELHFADNNVLRDL